MACYSNPPRTLSAGVRVDSKQIVAVLRKNNGAAQQTARGAGLAAPPHSQEQSQRERRH